MDGSRVQLLQSNCVAEVPRHDLRRGPESAQLLHANLWCSEALRVLYALLIQEGGHALLLHRLLLPPLLQRPLLLVVKLLLLVLVLVLLFLLLWLLTRHRKHRPLIQIHDLGSRRLRL